MKNLVLSLQILSARKLRTSLSVIGLVVGVAAVVVMVSVGRGAEKKILGRIQSMGTNLLIVSAAPAKNVAGRGRQSETMTLLTISDARALAEECPSAVDAVPAVHRPLLVRWEGNQVRTAVVGMTAPGFQVRGVPLQRGRFFDADEDRAKRRVAVIGSAVADNLFGGADPLGMSMLIGKAPFEVVGVISPRGLDANGNDQDDLILVPLETAMRRVFNVNYIQTVFVQARDRAAMGSAEEEVRELLRRRHRKDVATVQSQTAMLATERAAARSMTLLIGSVAGIALFVGGIGILAIMVMTVRERAKEIGLRRAVGARRRDILTQFLFESALLSSLGGVVGAAAGIGAASLPIWDAEVSWPAVVIAFLFSVSIGIAFGLYPAMRAARLEPIAALRSE